MPCSHVPGGVSNPLEVAVRPKDLCLGGAGGVERGAGGPVKKHVVGVFRGGRFSHGSGNCQGEGSSIGYPDPSGDLAGNARNPFLGGAPFPLHQPPPPAPVRITIGKAKRGIGSLLPGQAYVGRPGVLGNPFVVGRDGSRQVLISKMWRWLWVRLQEPGSPQVRELRRLLAQARAGELELLCWCHPFPCHAEVVRGAVLWLTGVEGLGRGGGDAPKRWCKHRRS